MKFFIFGAGYSSRYFACQQTEPIYGTTRQKEHFPLLQQANILPLIFSDPLPDLKLLTELQDTTHLIISIPPAPDCDRDLILRHPQIYSTIAHLAQSAQLQWIGYLSTIGVYGNHDGQWIDETATCYPTNLQNKKRIQIEQQWQDFAKHYDIPLAILRLAGIYGPGRNNLRKLSEGTARPILKSGQVFNRIHVADIASILYDFAQTKQKGLFNICDHEPAPPQEVMNYAASLMGITLPEPIPFERANLTPMARSFYENNKRVSNQRLLQTGYHFSYPTYREGLTKMWQSNQW